MRPASSEATDRGAHNMKWLKYVLMVLAPLLAIALALPLFISLEDYIPQIERDVSARLKEPVSIKSIRFSTLPVPHITVDGITIGTTDDIRLGKVQLTPDIFSLLRSTRVIKHIEIDTLALSQKMVERIPLWSKSGNVKSPHFRIKNISVNHALIHSGKASFGPFVAHVRIDNNGEPESASMATQDGKFQLLITPEQTHYRIEANAKGWTLPVGPPLVFDALSIKGVATLDDASLNQVSARLYGGTTQGNATISWRQGLQLKATLDIRQVEMRKISSMMSSKTHVSGKLSATPVLSASAASMDRLMDGLHLTTPFSIRSGVLYGVDFQKAAAGMLEQGPTGGETYFDQLTGHLVMDRGSYHFTRLKIASGTLAVNGDVHVSPKRELSGRVSVQLAAVGASSRVPLNVSGTVDAPLLFPTGGTMAGAAVGTVLMGPGVGTSVGAKIGGWLENLFGKTKEQ